MVWVSDSEQRRMPKLTSPRIHEVPNDYKLNSLLERCSIVGFSFALNLLCNLSVIPNINYSFDVLMKRLLKNGFVELVLC